jgi:hypothetical protein
MLGLVVENPGVGIVARSIVVSIMIQFQVRCCPMPKIGILLCVVKKRRISDKRSIALEDIQDTARNVGKK